MQNTKDTPAFNIIFPQHTLNSVNMIFQAADKTEYHPKCQTETIRQQYMKSTRKQHRDSRMNQLRKTNQMQVLNWRGVKRQQVIGIIEKCQNPYSLALTMFEISEQLNWRQWVNCIETLIHRFHNLCQLDGECINSLKHINNFQGRLIGMLRLGEVNIQKHMKLLLTLLLTYNKKYRILHEPSLSNQIVSMQKYVNVMWMLTDCDVSREAVAKLCKINIESQNLLPFLTIISNFVVEASQQDSYNLLQSQAIQKAIWKALINELHQVKREALLLINNFMAKDQACYNYIVSQGSLIASVQAIDNQQKKYFQAIVTTRQSKI